MLQQTQVVTVLPYFEKWMQLFPDFEALANAAEAEVVKAWEGLGYYSRARNLHRLAQQYVGTNPRPQTVDEWLQLPGVGPYTAAAVTSIALGERAAVVDGNVIRILTRLVADKTSYKDGGTAAKALTPLANQLIEAVAVPGDHNQAMMELGATLCVRKKPMCLLCPVNHLCAAHHEGQAEAYPKIERKKQIKREIARLWIVRQKKLLLHKNPPTAKRLANFCELPESDVFYEGKALPQMELIAQKSRGISNERILEKIYRLKRISSTVLKEIEANEELIWVPVDNIEGHTVSGPHRKWIRELL